MTTPPGVPQTAPKPPNKWVAFAAACGVGAAAICGPIVARFEDPPGGPALRPYRDIVGVWTQCSGETKGITAKTQVQTAEGCQTMLDRRLAEFGSQVLRCTPSLKGYDKQLAATISFAYNIGISGYCGSTAAKRFAAGPRSWASACDAFLMWNKAGGRVVKGLDNRRRAERALCLEDLPK